MRSITRRSLRFTALALGLGLTQGCGGPGDVVEPTTSAGARPAAAKPALPPDASVYLTLAHTVQPVDASSIREIREIDALFTQQPTDEGGIRDIDVEFSADLGPLSAYGPLWIVHIDAGAWIDWGDGGYRFDVSGPNDLPAVIHFLELQDGQVVADHTSHLESASGRLRFLPDAKVWSLGLELNGILTPTLDIAPDHEILGDVSAALVLGDALLPAVIGEAEALFESEPLRLKVESSIREIGEQSIREHVEMAWRFSGFEPLDANGVPLDLSLGFTKEPDWTKDEQPMWTAGEQPDWIEQPNWIIHLDGSAWIDGGTGFFKLAAAGDELPAVIQIRELEDGQIVSDLLPYLESVQATLVFDADAKAWLLTLELDSKEIIGPMYHPMLAAEAVSLEAGGAGAWAAIREGQATFF